MNDEVADALRLERRRQDERDMNRAREEHQLGELLEVQARRDADAALGRELRRRFGQNVTVDAFIHRERALSQAAKSLIDEMKEHPPERDELDCVLGRAFREAFGDDVSVEDVKHLRTVIQCAAPLYWIFNNDMDSAKKWEMLAHQAFTRLRRPDASPLT